MTVEELQAAVDEARQAGRKVATHAHGSSGMSPMQAILASTSNAARLIGIQDQVGTIEKGKLADLLLFEGNPLRRIDLLRDHSRIIGVMQAGKFVAGPLSKT